MEFTSLARLSTAERARSVVAAAPSVVWVAGDDAGFTSFEQECGLPMLLGGEDLAMSLLDAGAGRVEFDIHPALGVVRLAGQFWSVANSRAHARLDQVRREHGDCLSCPASNFTQIIGLQVITAAIRLPRERQFRAIDLDEYVLAQPDPVVVTGAGLSRHLNADHLEELALLASAVSGLSVANQCGARVGIVDTTGFELYVTGPEGGIRYLVEFPSPATDARQLPDLMHRAMAAAIQRAE